MFIDHHYTCSFSCFCREGNIAAINTSQVIAETYNASSFDEVLDATGCCVIPGLIDAHTHPVWAGDRVQEFSLKLAGASYMDVHKVSDRFTLFGNDLCSLQYSL